MAQTEAQKRAKAKYLRERPRVAFYLYPKDQDIIDRLAEIEEPDKEYITRLIREDIERDNQNKNGN